MTVPISNNHRSPKSRLALLPAITSIFFAFTLLFSGVRAEAQVKVGKPPKESVANRQIRTLDGKQFTIAGLRGQVVVLDFFAVWCGHSKKHIPTLTRFGDEERQQGLQIIGLAVQDNEYHLSCWNGSGRHLLELCSIARRFSPADPGLRARRAAGCALRRA
jgi:thiol-disulfide isomerase/thioredoxin